MRNPHTFAKRQRERKKAEKKRRRAEKKALRRKDTAYCRDCVEKFLGPDPSPDDFDQVTLPLLLDGTCPDCGGNRPYRFDSDSQEESE